MIKRMTKKQMMKRMKICVSAMIAMGLIGLGAFLQAIVSVIK